MYSLLNHQSLLTAGSMQRPESAHNVQLRVPSGPLARPSLFCTFLTLEVLFCLPDACAFSFYLSVTHFQIDNPTLAL